MPEGPPPTRERRRRPQRRRDRDRDRDRAAQRGRRTEDIAAGEFTSATTTAPEPPAAAMDEDDMNAFFGSGHGPAMHYDRSSQAADNEAGEPSGT